MQKHEDLKFLWIGVLVAYKRHTTKIICHSKKLLVYGFLQRL